MGISTNPGCVRDRCVSKNTGSSENRGIGSDECGLCYVCSVGDPPTAIEMFVSLDGSVVVVEVMGHNFTRPRRRWVPLAIRRQPPRRSLGCLAHRRLQSACCPTRLLD